jgi:ribonuclease HI
MSEPRQSVLVSDARPLEDQPDYLLVFDGGSIGNPGPGYGSYALIRTCDRDKRVVRLDFGREMTNNEAEYETLIAGLNDLIQRLTEANRCPSEFSLEVRGDSSLVVNQVNGVWKAKDERMRVRRNQVRELLARFATSRLKLQPRQESLKMLGH